MKQTREMLAAHHRDGVAFAQLMKDTFAERFNDEFWTLWEKAIAPVLSATPTILDIGAGPGMLLQALAARYPGVRGIGVECAPYMFNAAIELAENCEIISADLHDPHLPLEEGSVDAAIASVVLHEMHQPVRAMQEVNRCLKKGGRFYVFDWVRAPLEDYLSRSDFAVFDQQVPVSVLDDLFIHFIEHNRFSTDDLAFLLGKTGFKVLEKASIYKGRQARLIAEKI